MYHSEKLIKDLDKRAKQLRIDVLEMIHRRKAGHPGGSLSAADIVAALFFHHLKIDPKNPDREGRDRFILSKGHASALLYAALARRGFFPLEDLEQWGQIDCHLQGHPDRLKTPGVEMTTGVLGHGVAIGAGICLAARLKEKKFRTYVLLGCGECQSGNIWEGAMLASHYKLTKLTVIIDYNYVQLDGKGNEIMDTEPIVEKWESFGFAVLHINGHNMREVLEALDVSREIHSQPTAIIARTTKGKGVSFMEDDSYWHGVAPDDEELVRAVSEIKGEQNG